MRIEPKIKKQQPKLSKIWPEGKKEVSTWKLEGGRERDATCEAIWADGYLATAAKLSNAQWSVPCQTLKTLG